MSYLKNEYQNLRTLSWNSLNNFGGDTHKKARLFFLNWSCVEKEL